MGIEQDFVVGKRVLVLGASGLIGRGLVHVLSKNNEVHGLARFTAPKVKPELEKKCAKLWEVDVSQPGSLNSLPKDFDVVINEVVLWGINEPRDWDHFFDLLRTNAFVPGRVMEHFGQKGAKLVFGATGGAYLFSKDRNDLNREGVTGWRGGDHPYDDTKLAGEAIVHYLSTEHGIPAAILRYYWPVAPYHDGGRTGRSYRSWLDGKPTQVSKKNPWYHNVGYIADLVYGTIAAANKVASPPVTYNVSGSDIVTYREVDEALAQEMGVEPNWEEVEHERDMPMYLADVTRMSKDLWHPRFGLKETVRRVVRAMKEEIHEPQDWMFEC